MVVEFLIFLSIGAFAGLLAGMFGVGGGALIVPALIMVLDYFGHGGQWINHIAVASSLATIIGTSLSSSWVQNKNHNIEWSILKKMLLGCIIGTIGGSYMTPYIPGVWLKWIFIVFLIYTGSKFILKTGKVTKNENIQAVSLHNAVYVSIGGLIGCCIGWCGRWCISGSFFEEVRGRYAKSYRNVGSFHFTGRSWWYHWLYHCWMGY